MLQLHLLWLRLPKRQVKRYQEVTYHEENVVQRVPPQLRPAVWFYYVGFAAFAGVVDLHRFLHLIQHPKCLDHLDP